MTVVKVNIAEILDDSFYPGIIKFELTDIYGKRYIFTDKPVVLYFRGGTLMPAKIPCEGLLPCIVIHRSGNVVTIDTNIENIWVESDDEETVFDVSKENIFERSDNCGK